MDDAEHSRRRELLEKAFAVGGGLTPAQADELRRLDERRAHDEMSRSAGVPAPGSAEETSKDEWADDDASAASHPQRDDSPDTERPALPADFPHESAPASADHARRVRPTRKIAVGILTGLTCIGIGVGIGAAAFGGGDPGVRMSAAQQERAAKIERSSGVDAGSMTFLGEKDKALVWTATRDEGKRMCLVLAVGAQQDIQCQLSGVEGQDPLNAALAVEKREGRVVYWAVREEDIVGRQVTRLERQVADTEYDWRSGYGAEELKSADVLVAAGFDGASLQLVGSDSARFIWIGNGDSNCVVVATVSEVLAQQCDADFSGDGVRVELPDAAYAVSLTESHGLLLKIFPATGQ